MPAMGKVFEVTKAAGTRDHVKIMIGGVPVAVNLGGDPDFNERFVDHLYFDNCSAESE